MNDRFGIAGRLINVAACFEAGAKVSMVVDFSVVGYPNILVFIAHRLMAACEIDDRKTPMAEADLSVDVCSSVIGSAMCEAVPHSHEGRRVNRAVEVCRDGDSANSTHRC